MQINFAKFLKDAFYNEIKYSVIVAGRQTGKTYNACIWLVVHMLEEPNQRGLWVDVSQANLDRYVERYFFKIFEGAKHLMEYNKQSKILKFANGSVIDFRSAENPENLEGLAYDFVILNEAGIILKKDSLWYNSILPMTQHAQVKIIGTPKGKNLFHRLYHSNEMNWKSYKYTAYDSPYWQMEALEQIKKEIPQIVFQQEFLAEFTENKSSVFSSYAQCIVSTENLPPVRGEKYYAGVDLAKFTDFTVITIMNDKAEVVYIDRFNQLDYTFQKRKIIEVTSAYNAQVMMDSTGVGVAIYDDLKLILADKLTGYTFNNSSKKQLIEDLILGFESNNIKIPNNRELLSELETFEYTITRGGNISYNAADGFHDDMVISLALAYQLVKPNAFRLQPLYIDFI